MSDPCASKNRRFLARLRCAASGIRLVHRREKSFRAQTRLALAAAAATAALGADPAWADLLVLAAAGVAAAMVWDSLVTIQ